MLNTQTTIEEFDPELARAIKLEEHRQENHLELIASENYVSHCVLEAQGSTLTNKYAEGYSGKRYYGGCEHVDIVEDLAVTRVKLLFNAEFANVQPHSGSQANGAVYLALLQPGETVLGMSLTHGGHLTHGASVNFSGKVYNSVQYGLDVKTGLVDYNQVAELARLHKPKMIMTGFSAYSRILDWKKFREIADEVGAYLVADVAHVAGLIAAGLYPSPVPYADVVTSTTHKTLRGPRGGIIFGKENSEIEKKINSAIFPGSQGGPLMHIIAAKAVCFKEALDPSFKVYQQNVLDNARAMCQVFQERGYEIVSGGTDNHLLLIDLTNKQLTGKDAEAALGAANITVNKNTVPGETRSPFVTSGLRIGTPAMTTRGFKIAEVKQVANLVCDVLDNVSDTNTIGSVKKQVVDLCERFPVYTKQA